MADGGYVADVARGVRILDLHVARADVKTSERTEIRFTRLHQLQSQIPGCFIYSFHLKYLLRDSPGRLFFFARRLRGFERSRESGRFFTVLICSVGAPG